MARRPGVALFISVASRLKVLVHVSLPFMLLLQDERDDNEHGRDKEKDPNDDETRGELQVLFVSSLRGFRL
ncbi:hypothetical protein A2T55_15415 [Brevibacterium linens]|uniref:Uncharacterized protein n=1 Tax=Brevibacterium linens TaxID=1703 RepID=A0A144MEC5_BRELN|nr:hypothetical protein [Brevibacterium linens]AMT94943.1 hypothetical protein A2T55_15415 [Brevibacterium linens]